MNTNLDYVNTYFNELREIEKNLKECFQKRDWFNNRIDDLREQEKEAKKSLDIYTERFLKEINNKEEVSNNG